MCSGDDNFRAFGLVERSCAGPGRLEAGCFWLALVEPSPVVLAAYSSACLAASSASLCSLSACFFASFLALSSAFFFCSSLFFFCLVLSSTFAAPFPLLPSSIVSLLRWLCIQHLSNSSPRTLAAWRSRGRHCFYRYPTQKTGRQCFQCYLSFVDWSEHGVDS